MTKKLVIFLAIFWLFALSPVNAANQQLLSPDDLAWLRQNPDPIRVQNELDWQPYNFNDAGEPKGYSIDYLNLVAKKLDIRISYISGPSWNQFLEMMRNGSLDLMVNIASTKDRRTYLSFSEPYLITTASLYVRNSNNGISDLDDLAGKKIAFTEGFFFGEFIRKYYPDIEIVTFDSTLASFISVDKGLADAAIEVPVVAQRVLLEAKLTSLKKGGDITDSRFITTFAIATRKDELTLLGIIQKGMDAITPEEELSIRRRWNLEESELPLISTDERDYLDQLGGLRVCVNPDRLPLEAINLDRSLTGISSEFVKLLEENLKTPLNLVKTKDWNESIKFAADGKCDLLPMAIQTAERDRYLNFTSVWLSLPYVVATRHDQIYISNLDQVIDKEIGVVRGLATKEGLLAAYPKIKLVEVASVSDGLEKVDSGKLFGFVDTVSTISRAIQAGAITGVKISGEVGPTMNYAIGVKGGDSQLLGILERSLGAIEKEQIASIYNRWLAVAYIDRFDYTRFWQVLLGLALFTLYLFYRYRRGLQITAKLKIAHAEVEKVSRAKSDLMANISHEFKTPLNAIIGFSSTMKSETFGPLDKKYMEYADGINSSGEHLLEMINDILDVSAMEIGKLELQEENLDVGSVLEETMPMVNIRADEGNIHLTCAIDDGLPMLHADRRRLMQILLNLLSNAIKFTAPGGTVSFTASLDDRNACVLTVTDTGVGMNKKELAKAMAKFGRVDSGLERRHEGTGLGLPITMGLIELHGGTFEIESEKGKGTTVTVRFPPERTVTS